MGKRELVLILGFIALGVLVYQVTAPDRPADAPGVTASGILDRLRGAFRQERVPATVTREAKQAVPGTVRALGVAGFRGKLTIVGSSREDASASLTATVFGSDEADARRLAEQAVLTLSPEGDRLVVGVRLPPQRRRPVVDLRIELPARLVVALEARGELQVRGVAAVELDTRAGAVTLQDIATSVTGEHREGELTVTGTGEVRLETRRVTVRLTKVRGPVVGDLLDGRALLREVGSVTLETRRVDVEIEGASGAVSLTSDDGQAIVRDVRAAVTFEGERCRLALAPQRAVEVKATSSDASVELQLPGEGATIDASTDDGRLDVPADLLWTITREDAPRRERTEALWQGGGPTMRLATTRGDIVVRR